jgi:acetyl esterase/lipase
VVGCGGGNGTTDSAPVPRSSTAVTVPAGRIQNIGGAPGLPKAVWGAPTDGQKSRGVLMMIHGGSWAGISASQFKTMQATATVFQGLGFETFTVDYRSGAQGVTDVDNLYRDARREVGPKVPICAAGISAGAQIALMVAIRNPGLACVLDLAGPTDLPAFKMEPGGATLYRVILDRFGTGPLEQYSPALHGSSIKAKVLMIYAEDDPLVPVAQGRAMARADPAAKLIVLPPGSAPFVHTGVGAPAQASGVDPKAYATAESAEVRFLEDAMSTSN